MLMSLVWFATANHCFMSAAFSEPLQKKKSNASHRCCGKEEKEKTPISPHKGCDKAACCQPVIQADSGTTIVAPGENFIVPVFPSAALTALFPPELDLFLAEHHCIGPPDTFLSLLTSLSVAQNAPPLFS